MNTAGTKEVKPWKEGDSIMLSNEEIVLTGQLRDFGHSIIDEILKRDSAMTSDELFKMTPKEFFEYIENFKRI